MIAVLVVELLLLHGVRGNITNACPTSPDANVTVCQKEECFLMADELLETMNSNKDPCQNFYQYACGGWLDQQFLNPHRTRVTTIENNLPLALTRKFLAEEINRRDHPSVRKAKDVYQLCIQFTNSTPQYNAVDYVIIDKFSRWPLVYDRNRSTLFDLESSLQEAFKLGIQPLFTLQADPSSFKDPETRRLRSKLYVGKPVLGMPIDRYIEFNDHAIYRHIYAKKILKDAENFGSFNRTRALQDALEIVHVEETLAMMYISLPTKGANVSMTLQALTAQYGQFLNWTNFVSELASSPEIGITDITPQEVVIVSDPEYLRQMANYFPRLSNRTQANYFYWRVIESLQHVLIEDHRKLKFFLTDTARGSRLYPYTELDCVKYVSQVFDLVVHRFLYQALKPRTMRLASVIFWRIWGEFKRLIDGPETRLVWANEHILRTLRYKIGPIWPFYYYYETAMNDSLLDSYYSNIPFGASDFINFDMIARKVAFVRDFKNIRRNTEAEPRPLHYQKLAEHSAKNNKLYLSPLILHHPFYNNVKYMTHVFAGFGTIVARALLREFDTIKFRLTGGGVISEYWDADTIRQFLEPTQCFVDQYNGFFYDTAELHVNGNMTLDSNIADVSALKIAYKAYITYVPSPVDKIKAIRLPGVTLSNEQVFFVKFAQLWCSKETRLVALSTMSGKQSPDEFRVNGPLRNLPGFATAFNCSAGSFMNPPNKCLMW